MTPCRKQWMPLADRGPLRVAFLLTSMPVGGAETLLLNLTRKLDRELFSPELYCLKELGPLGETLAQEIPAFCDFIHHKYDVAVVRRLNRIFRQRQVDAVVTVGAGDKMFWGRLAAWWAGVPVILSALHSTGWPDGVGRLNRRLTRITDGFIGVAAEHGRFLCDFERFPKSKVFVIPNGVEVERFSNPTNTRKLRQQLGIAAEAPLVGIVAALRPEKNHELFIRTAAEVRKQLPNAQFLIIGDGPRRSDLETLTRELNLSETVHFLGTRHDIPELLQTLDLFLLTSRNEANPVSILEAMAAGKPVVAPNVGSIAEAVGDGETGLLTTTGTHEEVAQKVLELLRSPERMRKMGDAGHATVVSHWSLENMVGRYQDLIRMIYSSKTARRTPGQGSCSALPPVNSAT